MQGVWSRWVINYEVANGDAGIMSKKQGLVHLPVSGWLYWDGSTVQGDDTLTVTGKYISYLKIGSPPKLPFPLDLVRIVI